MSDRPLIRALAMGALVVSAEAVFLLPFVLPRVFRPTVLEVFGIDNWQLGLAFSAYGQVAMVAYFLGGPIADALPARRIMAVALGLTATGGLALLAEPSPSLLTALYAFWGLTSILLYWAALIRATREWGGADGAGRAFGLLDGGRGLVAALLSTASVAVFAAALPGEAAAASLAEKTHALQVVIGCYIGVALLSAGVVLALLPRGGQTGVAPARPTRAEGLARLRRVLRMPQVYLHGLVVVCAYTAYKGSDDFSLLAADGWGMDAVEAAQVGTVSFWIRPLAALGAGMLADRMRGSRVLIGCFVLLALGDALVASGWLPTSSPAALLAAVVGTSVFVFALRGVYFAIFDQGRVPVAVTGTAVGLVSFLGYTPDVFFGPLMGLLLDGSPGLAGHQHLFWLLAGFALLGALATVAFERVSARAPRVDGGQGIEDEARATG